jgi:signal-transduction protein with cAMP-binding, CBS, and nucleotidyltransferase domain
MRKNAVRRLPVVDEGEAIGIVALGDLAVERNPDSALSDISAALPNSYDALRTARLVATAPDR